VIGQLIDLPRWRLRDLPVVSAAEMRAIDRLATDEFGIALAQMMELAGSSLARLADELLDDGAARRVAVLVGPGHNGGGGLVAARHLANRGVAVEVVLAAPVGWLRPIARERVATLIAMDVPCCVVPWDIDGEALAALLARSGLVVDALLGYSADGAPRGTVAGLIERVVASGVPVLSLDLPSGVGADTGAVAGLALTAAATLALALPKRGLVTAEGRARSGDLFLADIGLPAALYARLALTFGDPFGDGPLVRLD
jgi:NAD(P)H-hydrate epimerase